MQLQQRFGQQGLAAGSAALPAAPRAACRASQQPAPQGSSRQGGGAAPEPLREQQLRIQLASRFPNALLLPGARLPSLQRSKHFLNLTNGLELAPLLQRLRLPFSVCRLRSTALEQQAFEALLLELDASLLLALALGHSCVVWDCGCRSASNAAPRALWYGLEFVRFALTRAWLGPGAPGAGLAHLRGYSVLRDFEAACRGFKGATKARLRYYRRYVAPGVQQRGLRLAGAFKRTERDEDVAFFVAAATQHLAPGAAAAAPGGGGADALQTWQQPQPAGGARASSASEQQLCEADCAAYELLAGEGFGLLTGGLSHQQWRELQAAGIRMPGLQGSSEAAG